MELTLVTSASVAVSVSHSGKGDVASYLKSREFELFLAATAEVAIAEAEGATEDLVPDLTSPLASKSQGK